MVVLGSFTATILHKRILEELNATIICVSIAMIDRHGEKRAQPLSAANVFVSTLREYTHYDGG
jgi:hypothetical protein